MDPRGLTFFSFGEGGWHLDYLIFYCSQYLHQDILNNITFLSYMFCPNFSLYHV
jgi:hypothetical protein